MNALVEFCRLRNSTPLTIATPTKRAPITSIIIGPIELEDPPVVGSGDDCTVGVAVAELTITEGAGTVVGTIVSVAGTGVAVGAASVIVGVTAVRVGNAD